ncbi:unnamed protein product, partial [marine sediment metagenome]
ILMPELRRTNSVRGHWHLAYIGNDGQGYTSYDKKHRHSVETELIEPEAPEEGALEVPEEEEEEPTLELGDVKVGEANGHTHKLRDLPEPKEPDKKPDNELAAEVVRQFREIHEYERASYEMALKAEGFYSGDDQWDKTIKNKLEGESRAALTINEIEPKMDLLSGYQRQNRMDIRYLPVEGSDARWADILNIVVKNIMTQNEFESEESEIFDDELIVGRGNINIDVDYDSNLDGDIIVERFPWQDVRYGPHEKKNLKDLEILTKDKWYSRSKVEQMWPEKAERIDELFAVDEASPDQGITV